MTVFQWQRETTGIAEIEDLWLKMVDEVKALASAIDRSA